MSRANAITIKVESENFAPIYLHLAHSDGRVVGFSISHPGRFERTTIGDLLDRIADALDAAIVELNAKVP
jgi:hypothetical protein